MKLKPFFTYLFLSCVATMFLVQCASTGSPSGGPRDTDPPELVVEESAPNFEVNYTPKEIELVFNEFVELKNQAQEILISPPFFKQPKISSRGKKVTISFPEEEPLRPDATYTINFGKSIVDYTESNAKEGFRFVFATGDKIDSLTFDGKVVDAYGGDPIKDVLVLLYDVLEDSVVVYEKPFYYARTDDDGGFKFENLKNDTFKLLILEDKNVNYLLDPEVERLAFSDSLFVLNDSSTYSPVLRIFEPEQTTRIIDSNSKTKGKIVSVFNKPAEKVSYSYLYPENWNPIVEESKDTLSFWFSEPIDSAGIVLGLDTLDFTIKPFDSLFYAKKIRVKNTNTKSTKLAPFDSLLLHFNAPVLSYDTSLITLSDKIIIPKEKEATDSLVLDSLGVDSLALGVDTVSLIVDTLDTQIAVDSLALDSLGNVLEIEPDTVEIYTYDAAVKDHKIQISKKWKEGHDYQITFLAGAVTDIYGRSNDSLTIKFTTNSLDEYGSIALNAVGLDSTLQYVILLRDGDEVVRQVIIKDTKEGIVNFSRLPVSTYNVHLVEDLNRDGQWTTGDYWQKRQPESLKEFELEKLREDWDLEANISWSGIAPAITGDTVIDSLSVPQKIDELKSKKKTPKSKVKPGSIKGSKGKID